MDSGFSLVVDIVVIFQRANDARSQHPIALPQFVVFVYLALLSRYPFLLAILQLLFLLLRVIVGDVVEISALVVVPFPIEPANITLS